MGYRNMEKITEKVRSYFFKTKYLHHYAMTIDEMCKLHQMCLEDKDVEAIDIAFQYGFALGTRAHDKKHIPVL